MAVFPRQCHFQNLPLLSQKSLLTTENFHCFASPGKVSALALKNEDSMHKEKHSLRNFAVLLCYNPGELLKEIPPYLNRDF